MTTTLRTAADVVANITPILGFVPTHSVVAYLLRRSDTETAIISLVRLDVDSPVAAASAALDDLDLRRLGVNAVIIVAICPPHDPRVGNLVDHLHDTFTDAGATVLRRLHTETVEHPGQWTDLDTGDTGPTHGYRDTVAAADAVHHGRVIATRREDIEREFTPVDAAPPVPVVTRTSS